MLPICNSCSVLMQCALNEVPVKDEATGKSPSTVRYGDLYECPKCGHQIIIGFGKPISQPSDALLKQARTYTYD